jgi:uncharacterized membrane protein
VALPATDEQRTFTVSYRLNGLAVAYDDVVDVYWQAWGDEWEESLGSLEATMVLPGDARKGEVKVFGHPASVSGKASLGPDWVSPTLFASDVPPEQFVEMRVLSPRELLASSGGPGWSLRMGFRRSWTRRPRKSSIRGPLGTANAPACAVRAARRSGREIDGALVYVRYGREPMVDYGEIYEREPSTNDPPAAVSAIMGQNTSVGIREFAATLFDLIRRGVLKAQPVSVKQGNLLGEKTRTDLRMDLTPRGT